MYQQGRVADATIVDLCLADGHWSIWMTVFAGIKEIVLALIAAFPATVSANCFDANGLPTVRPGGQI